MLVSPLAKFFAFRFTSDSFSEGTQMEYKPLTCDLVSPKAMTAIIPEKFETFYINPETLGKFRGGFVMKQLIVPKAFYASAFPLRGVSTPLCGDWFVDGNAERIPLWTAYLNNWDAFLASFFYISSDFFDYRLFSNGNAQDPGGHSVEVFFYRVNSWSFDDDYFYVNLLRHPVPNRSIFLHGNIFDRARLTNIRPMVKVKNKVF